MFLFVNNLVHQSEVFNLSNAVVHSMSISAMYSLLLVAPCSFRNAVCIYPFPKSSPREERVYNEAVDLLEKFHRLVSRTQYSPDSWLDGHQCVRDFNDKNGRTRLTSMQSACRDFIDSLSSLCRLSEKARRKLDKPNVHRLLEFYSYTVPALGRIDVIQELVLERGHQELKRGVVR